MYLQVELVLLLFYISWGFLYHLSGEDFTVKLLLRSLACSAALVEVQKANAVEGKFLDVKVTIYFLCCS